jgi:hypothetical protein
MHGSHGENQAHFTSKGHTMSDVKSSKFKKIARIRDKATDTYIEVIQFPISKTEMGKIELAPSVVNELSGFEKKLRDAGAVLPKDKIAIKNLLEDLAKSDAPRQWVYESKTGWTADRSGYVLRTGFIGNSNIQILGVADRAHKGRQSIQTTEAGTSKDWRDTVGVYAGDSTSMIFALSVAFTAPLLAIMNRPSFGINLAGPSGTGKSTATLMAASIIGMAQVPDLLSWNATEAGLEERLAEFNDMLFPIDELRSLKGKNKKEKYERVRTFTYNLVHGRPTERHSAFEKSQAREQPGWRSILLTSNEKPISELALAAGEAREPGETRRLIDVPVLFDSLDHIFDRLPVDFDYSTLHAWKTERFKLIADACLQNHGKVLRRYIKALLARQSDLQVYIEKRIAFFLKKVGDDLDGVVARDVAEKFGLIYASGRLGIRAGIIPWAKRDLLAAIAKAYLAARDLLPDQGRVLRQGINLLRAKLSELPRASNRSAKKTDFDQLDGYRKRRDGKTFYLIKREVFNSLFNSEPQRKLVIQWLIEDSLITLAGSKDGAGTLAPQPQHQFVWRDTRRRHSYEIRRLPHR